MLEGFKTAKGEKLTKERLIKEIEDFILADNNFNYRILVGTDSEIFDHKIDFVSVIVIHRIGYGSRYFWQRKICNSKFRLHERLWQEALLSLNISQELLKILTQRKLSFQFELHLDLGTVGKSSSSVKEIINLIRGYGFEVKIKPESYAASKIADRLI
ncbi:MAG: hypothetical protein KatS3mg096_040 [Candidatus Parcubacteria bacterium]|nr:MAG: hypothetical protein KatS3mg096_040 [Candidatus Parcubacteria bacterium]